MCPTKRNIISGLLLTFEYQMKKQKFPRAMAYLYNYSVDITLWKNLNEGTVPQFVMPHS